MAQLKLRMALERRVVARKAEREAEQQKTPKIPGGSGAALDGDVRKKMESQLGADLSGARIHTGGESAQAARGFGARAFTVGNDVHFNSGEFKPGTKEGDRLLAHELTHVVQGQGTPTVARKAEDKVDGGMPSQDEAKQGEGEEVEVSQPGDAAEKEADAVADHATGNLHAEGEEKGGDEKGGEAEGTEAEGEEKEGGGGAKGEKGGAKKKEKGGEKKAADKPADKPGEKQEKQDKPDKKPGEKQEKPKIAAKLEGVGRKIFRNVQTGTTTGTITNSYAVGAGPSPQVQGEFQPNRQPGVNPEAENPNFEADAVEFEKNLGGVAFGKASSVGAALTGKVKAYIQSKVSTDDFDKLGAETQKLLSECGKADPSFAGSVGTDPKVIQQILLSQAELTALKAQIDQAKGDAEKLKNLPEPPNIREQMTLVYNFTTKIMVKDIMNASATKQGLSDLVSKAGLNANAVQQRVAFMQEQAKQRTDKQKEKADGPGGNSSWDLVGMVPQDQKGKNINDGEGSADAKTTQAVEGQWSARDKRTNVDPQANLQQKESQNPSASGDGQATKPPDRSDRNAGDVEEKGAGLSDREKKVQGISGDEDPLKWSEGAKMWVINEKDKWVQAMRELNLPLAAGPSGTTNVLMNANAMLGATDPAQARLACIGYLLPISAHSLVEVCAAASAHGVPFTAGKGIYKNLPPLDTEGELRGCGRQAKDGKKKLFPDEGDPADQKQQQQQGGQGNAPGGPPGH